VKKIINPQMGLFAVGVLQPASAAEVRGLLQTLFKDGGELPPAAEFSRFLREQAEYARLIRVAFRGGAFYSLTVSGNHYLAPGIRIARDKIRVYLLRDAHRGRIIESRGSAEEGLAGVSPAVDASSTLKGSAANKPGRRFTAGRVYWPRVSRQFAPGTGLTRPPRDNFPRLLSFSTPAEAVSAASTEARKLIHDYTGLGLLLGISPKLISEIAYNPSRHYRRFMLPKKGGGERPIESPRVLLKVIQWFLSDFVLDRLSSHESVHSFKIGKSIVTNAKQHTGQGFVGNVNIEDFFGSVTRKAVIEHLIRNKFEETEAKVISQLCTNDDRLPQGAPTSPIISNSLLFDLDHQMTEFCASRSLRYSRYADDITISGGERGSVKEAIDRADCLLHRLYGLRLNSEKTRIASRGGQQRVTGVVVNREAAPARRFRRRVRAIFHHARLQPHRYMDRVAELNGYVGYLRSFPKLAGTQEVSRYESVLRDLRSVQKGKPRGRTRHRAG
jgi:retron-type reverse transcriptase